MFAALKAGKPMSEAVVSNGVNSVSNPWATAMGFEPTTT